MIDNIKWYTDKSTISFQIQIPSLCFFSHQFLWHFPQSFAVNRGTTGFLSKIFFSFLKTFNFVISFLNMLQIVWSFKYLDLEATFFALPLCFLSEDNSSSIHKALLFFLLFLFRSGAFFSTAFPKIATSVQRNIYINFLQNCRPIWTFDIINK